VKVLVFPRDERMRSLISLKAFGLSELDAVRYYTAMLMAQHGILSAPNMAIGQPFNIGGPNTPILSPAPIPAPAQVAPQQQQGGAPAQHMPPRPPGQ